MKKYLITLLSCLMCLTTKVYAHEGVYLKTSIGLNYIPKQNIKDNQLVGNLTLKQKFPVIGLGIGYQTEDLWRVEMALDYYFLFTQTEKSMIDDLNYNVNINTKISDLMINIYKGFELSDKTSVFFGGGVGVSSIQDDATGYFKFDDESYQVLEPTKGKHVYRYAYKLTCGIDYKLKESITGEISYNFYKLGKNKSHLNIIQHSFNNHNLTLGVRFGL